MELRFSKWQRRTTDVLNQHGLFRTLTGPILTFTEVIRFFAFLLFFFFSLPVHPWGNRGHQLIAQIAKSRLQPEVADMVSHLLGTPDWEKASCWMDEVEKEPRYQYMKPWHFVSFEKDKTYVSGKNPDLVNRLEISLKTVQNRSKYPSEYVGEALRSLFHLVGDLHQPLHCGFPSDHCGNDIGINYAGKQVSLHQLWDAVLIEDNKIVIWDCLKKVISEMHSKKKTGNTDFIAWMNESRGCLPAVYDFKNKDADKGWQDKNVEIIKLQLARAGMRLADLLNELFKD
jgi:hypothetical protein